MFTLGTFFCRFSLSFWNYGTHSDLGNALDLHNCVINFSNIWGTEAAEMVQDNSCPDSSIGSSIYFDWANIGSKHYWIRDHHISTHHLFPW